MKISGVLTFLLLLFISELTVESQKLKAGFYSGVNFSDLHGQQFGGKWSPVAGPSEGVRLQYNFAGPLSLSAGLGFAGLNYKYTTYQYPIYDIYPHYLSNIIAPVEVYSTVTNFSVTKIPLLLELKIPSLPDLSLGAGVLFSFIHGSGRSQNFMLTYNPSRFRDKDFGYQFTAGWDHPVTSRIDAELDLNYITGRKLIVNGGNARHGYSEITFGLNYNFGKAESFAPEKKIQKDSISKGIIVSYFAGPTLSVLKQLKQDKDYKPLTGFNAGIGLTFPFRGGASFTTGIRLERSGYAIKDSSNMNYLITNNSSLSYYVDSKVITERLVVPFLLDIPMGRSQRLFLSTGPMLAFKLNGRNTGTATNEGRYESQYLLRKTTIYDDMEYLLNDFDTGWIFSGSYLFQLADACKLKVALTYTRGFREFYEKGALSMFTGSSDAAAGLRNQTLSLSLGFIVPSYNAGRK